MNRKPFPSITFEGKVYKLKRHNLEVPKLEEMERMAALMWLNQNTWPRGYQKPAHPLTGIGGAVTIK